MERSPLLTRTLSYETRHEHLHSFDVGFPSVVDDDEVLSSPKALFLSRTTTCKRPWWSNGAVLLTLLMSSIGSGTLAVPYTFLLLSPTQAVVTTCVVGLTMAFTADVILRVHVAVVASSQNINIRETYQELALHAGGKVLSRFVSFVAMFAVFGACVGCVRVVQDMAPALLSMIYPSYSHQSLQEQQSLVLHLVWILFMVMILPIGFSKNISVLRYSSYIGFICCLYLVGAIAYRSFDGVTDNSTSVPPIEIYASWFSRLTVAIGIYNFTFMLHLNVIPLFPQTIDSTTTLSDSKTTMSRLIYTAVAICVVLYAVFGVCAASMYGPFTQGNILLNLAHDPIMTVPRLVILLTILFSFPLLFHPLRSLVLEILTYWQDQESYPSPHLSIQVGISILLMALQILVATHVPGIQVVFSFVGSSILLVLCYLMPLIFYIRLYPWRSTAFGRLRLIALCTICIVETIVCLYATIQLFHAP